MAVESGLKKAIRISRDAYMYVGELSGDVNGDGALPLDVSDYVNEDVFVEITIGKDDSDDFYFGEYDAENDQVIFHSVTDETTASENTTISCRFLLVGV